MNHSMLGGAAAIFALSLAPSARSTAATTSGPRLAFADRDSLASPCRVDEFDVLGTPVACSLR